MTDQNDISQRMEQIRQLMRDKLGVRGRDFEAALIKARHRLPRNLFRAGQTLVAVQPKLQHPKLRRTLDAAPLLQSAEALQEHLEGIDLAEKRKRFVLGMLGGLAFNLLVFFGLVIGFLFWRGYL